MLVCVFFAQFAHETAGAARTRYPLLPPFEGDGRRISSGRAAPASVDARPGFPYLAPLAGRGRPAKRSEAGRVRGLSAQSVFVERGPSPHPLPAKSGAREMR